MIQKYYFPNPESWEEICARPSINDEILTKKVQEISTKVKEEGDKALFYYNKLYDGFTDDKLQCEAIELDECENLVTNELKEAINLAKRNIEIFHKAQFEAVKYIETIPGVSCWRKSLPIEKVGLYIPGGTAPLFSTVLMLGVPAQLAGVQEIILLSPPNKDGKIDPAILYCAKLCGITKIFKIGGAQAIAALSIGTESIPKVYKIFGPGNQYVTKAKELAQMNGTAIDMPAGPSELLVIADETCVPEFVAADLLSQAEHGIDSQVLLLSTKKQVLEEVAFELQKQIQNLPRKEIAMEALESSKLILLNSMDECIDFSNLYAPEHLIISSIFENKFLEKITNAGSVFLGNYSCESAGDYASGTNHTLPTKGFAKNYSGVSLDSFFKKISFQRISSEGIKNIGPAIEIMADAEKLFAHKNAVTLRLKSLSNE
jgi:histidinol dehydrogenase